MRESLKIIYQLITNLTLGPIKLNDYKLSLQSRALMKNKMESLIHHFKLCTEGFKINYSIMIILMLFNYKSKLNK